MFSTVEIFYFRKQKKVIMILFKKKELIWRQGKPEAPHSCYFFNMPQRSVGAKKQGSALQGKPLAQLKKEGAVSRGGRGPGIKERGWE